MKLASTIRIYLGDQHTPVGIFKALKEISPQSVLLESVISGNSLGRYSIIGLNPIASFIYEKETCRVRLNDREFESKSNPFELLKEIKSGLACEKKYDTGKDLLPFSDPTWIGYLGYDMIRCVEDIPASNPASTDLPDCNLIIPSFLVIFDHFRQTMTLNYFGINDENFSSNADVQFTRITEIIKNSRKDSLSLYTEDTSSDSGEFESSMDGDKFKEIVTKGKKHIYDGDVYQVVLSRCLNTEFSGTDLELYRRLRAINPSPYLYCLCFGTFSIVGSSPEMLVKKTGSHVTIRPIAGTAPRGETEAEDLELERKLLADEKEVSEHMMLVDLARNDIGRVCEPGTVRPVKLKTIENYSHVKHIVTIVEGKIKPEHDAMDLLKAAFPAGTLSGAPKIRAMEIIDDLENVKRGIYGGSVLFWDLNDNLDSCIIIRSALINDGKVYVHSGAGIVADSDPDTELNETLKKAGAVIQAINSIKKR